MASLLGNMGADWLLKRAFKFLLKKNLGSILQNEVRAAPQTPVSSITSLFVVCQCQFAGCPDALCSSKFSSMSECCMFGTRSLSLVLKQPGIIKVICRWIWTC